MSRCPRCLRRFVFKLVKRYGNERKLSMVVRRDNFEAAFMAETLISSVWNRYVDTDIFSFLNTVENFIIISKYIYQEF
jgi:hypothetical protein